MLQTLVFTEFTKPSTQLTKKNIKVCKTVCYTELFFIDLMLLLLSSYYTLCCKQMLVWVFFTKNNSGLRGTCKLVLHAPAVDLESFTSTQEIKKLYSRPKSYIPSTINIEFTLCHHIQLNVYALVYFEPEKYTLKPKLTFFKLFCQLTFQRRH